VGHDHDHQHVSIRAGARHAGRLRTAFVLILAFLVVQVVVGLATNSLALLSDAGHMATDALGLGMALAAITAANRAEAHRHGSSDDSLDHRTFGLYRLEILAALANAVLLFAVAGYVLVEAVLRLRDPAEVQSLPVLLVGVLGLGVNVVAFLLLRAGAAESLNVRGAYLEVVSDMLGSVGVIVAALLLWLTGWDWVDPVVGAAIGLFILPRAYRLGRDAVRVLVQAAPPELDVDLIRAALLELDGVAGVHDLHVWTLTSEMHVMSAHVLVRDHTDRSVLPRAQQVLTERFGLQHATLQLEPCDEPGCSDIGW
jgi:cobalt-zinc-cadmium efflux system protein